MNYIIMLYYNFDQYLLEEKLEFRGILSLEFQTGSGSDQILKTGLGSDQNTRTSYITMFTYILEEKNSGRNSFSRIWVPILGSDSVILTVGWGSVFEGRIPFNPA